ncbi:MAG: hypothetical protein H6824_10300 [Planctomycetaceae bacterium]|nr:hypothetical protein [Planctomycetaceae bacterium]
MFGHFWYQDPLIDFTESDFDLIHTIIEQNSTNKQIFWPLAQGRILYDRFLELGFSRTDSLTPQETADLLADVPQGIYQAGGIVSGPLGLVASQCIRNFRPRNGLGLWHCSMLDCRKLHRVQFGRPRIRLAEAYDKIADATVDHWKDESRWEWPVASWPLSPENDWKSLSEMPLFLGDCIVDSERAVLLKAVLESSDGAPIREILRKKRSDITSGKSADILKELSGMEQLQLLLVLQDETILRHIDELVREGAIVVPTTEVREVDNSKLATCRLRAGASIELSSLGIRTVRQSPILLLRHLVMKSYMEAAELADLNWRIGTKEASDTESTLFEFLRAATPSVAIDKLVLTSPRIANSVARELNTEVRTPGEESRKSLEWKLGFDLPRDGGRLAMIGALLDRFRDTLSRIGTPACDAERHEIRSSGVNAFVELEGVLDEVISYLVWFLYSDHAKDTHFLYTKKSASRLVPTALGAILSSGDEAVAWNTSGNALGTCLRYFQELEKWIGELPLKDRDCLKRDNDAMNPSPSDSVTIFPFKHSQMWADASAAALRQLGTLIERAAKILNQGSVPASRNGLEHFREPSLFPSTDKLLATVESMQEFIRFIDEERLFPKLYWIGGTTTDSYGQRSIRLIDSGNTFHVMHGPRTVVGTLVTRGLSRARPVLLAPGNIFGLPNSELLFEIRQDSEYSSYWENYPARDDNLILAGIEPERQLDEPSDEPEFLPTAAHD